MKLNLKFEYACLSSLKNCKIDPFRKNAICDKKNIISFVHNLINKSTGSRKGLYSE